jgi:cytochrome c oxidase subunit II
MTGAQVGTVTNMFRPLSTPAESIAGLSLLVVSVCVAIFVVVAGVLAYTIVRFRRSSSDVDREPPQVYGSSQIEIAWTVIPVLIVIVLTLATARVITEVQDKPRPEDALTVRVIGHQWWWEIRYPVLGVVTANELHVPVSTPSAHRPTFLLLESVDVAHSFWVPQLAGKTDLIPNHPNWMWIEPKVEGTYIGNCAEFCGLQHANMLIRVVVESADDFSRWVEHQKAAPATGQPGEKLFLNLSCVNCHTVAGTSAKGTFGPDLTHLMSRQTLGSGVMQNTAEHLRHWIRDPQDVKPGNLMPNMQLSDREVDQVREYLTTLE